jgi:DNA-binding transcriptional MerR regulator
MASLKDMFSKKHEEHMEQPQQAPPPSGVPIEHVVTMKGQGLTHNQIIQSLQRYGYSVDQINTAINQADIKEGITTTPFQPVHPPGQEMHNPEHTASAPFMSQQSTPPSSAHLMQPQMVDASQEEKIHEIAEAIIDEKWNVLVDNVNTILEWKDAVEARVTKLESRIESLQHSFDKLHEGILGKIGDYDKGLQQVSVEIKALEKVFQKILPGFVDNVKELSRITDKMKKK